MTEKIDHNTTSAHYIPQGINQTNLDKQLDAELAETTAFSWDVFSRIKDQLEDNELISILRTAQESFLVFFKMIVNSFKSGFYGKETRQFSPAIIQIINDFFAHLTPDKKYNLLTRKIMRETRHILAANKQHLVQQAPKQGSMIFNVLTPLEIQMITTCRKMLLQIEQLLAQSTHHQTSSLFNMTAPSNTELPAGTYPAKAK